MQGLFVLVCTCVNHLEQTGGSAGPLRWARVFCPRTAADRILLLFVSRQENRTPVILKQRLQVTHTR